MYRPCPVCGKLMNRQNYGRRSGVILDSCSEHGLWFDHGELETILRWVRDGGLARADELEHEKRREEVRARNHTGPVGPLFESAPAAGVGASGVLVARLIERVLDFLLDFRK
ncbi:MAG: zf-TFIIB domain-containing protein [Acidobacteriota bacterium]|nr:zf-TFIIB domain-containing protein [Acidobacteriota bacterium]